MVETFFKPRKRKKNESWRARYGDWIDERGFLDDVVLLCYEASFSYTGQDMFEVFCHGNPLIVEGIVASLLGAGCRMARPGEFTMRAVLNGRMSLLEAEAVNASIEATTRYGLDLVRRQAKGPLVVFVNEKVAEIIKIQAHLEANIDYGEEDIDVPSRGYLLDLIEKMIMDFEKTAATASFSRSMFRGFRVLITGEPNVGKSTLFNGLVKQERAIVTDLPGTTRDLISEQVEMLGLPVILLDSAGVRDTTDVVESIGIAKIMEKIHDVDLVLFLTTMEHRREPYEALRELPDHKWMRVFTKIDRFPLNGEGERGVSALTGAGMLQLEKEIVLRLSSSMQDQPLYVINQRQEGLIRATIENLNQAKEQYAAGFGEEVLSFYLNHARMILGELTGETNVEDVLDKMFSDFCLGK